MKSKGQQATSEAILALMLAAINILSGCGEPVAAPVATAPAPAAVRMTQVRKGEATRSITLPANVLPFQQAVLCAKVAGYVKAISVDKGDEVKQGDLLADIEVPELVAEQARSKAELDFAILDYTRVREAQGKAPDLVVPQSVDIAKSKADIAKANLERTETLLGFARITAPFSGVITRRMVDPGAFIPAASGSGAEDAALMTLMDFSKVRVQVAIPEAEVPMIKNGLAATVSVEELPAASFQGAITRYSHALDLATRSMLAEIELANPRRDLRPGMYATVRIIVERKPDVLLIPAEALVVEKTRQSVFSIADNKARRLTIKTGFNDGGWVEVEGLTVGQPLILVGKQALVDGQPVTVTETK